MSYSANLGSVHSDVAVSVFMPSGFAVEYVVLHPSENASGARLEARILQGVPSGVPAPKLNGPAAVMFDLSVTTPDGRLPMNAVIIHFLVDGDWLSSHCPPASCAVGVLHWTGTEWETLSAERQETRGDGSAHFVAVARSLSPFVVAGLAGGASGFPSVDQGDDGSALDTGAPPLPIGGLVWPALFLLGGLLVVVTILLVRQSRGRPPDQPPEPPLPPPAVDAPQARRPSAHSREAEAESLFGLMDEASAPTPDGRPGPPS